jgi:hypothetical protein
MSDMALIKFVLYATLSLIEYTVNSEAARFSLRLPSSGIVRPCSLVHLVSVSEETLASILRIEELL